MRPPELCLVEKNILHTLDSHCTRLRWRHSPCAPINLPASIVAEARVDAIFVLDSGLFYFPIHSVTRPFFCISVSALFCKENISILFVLVICVNIIKIMKPDERNNSEGWLEGLRTRKIVAY